MKLARKNGFSLIELLIVVVIIGILASIAFPSYTGYLKKARRSDGQGCLLGFANAMDRYYTQNNTYTGAANGGGDTGAPDASIYSNKCPLDGSTTYYALTINSSSDIAYTLFATPQGPQTSDGRLELDSTGAKRWNSKDDGTGTDSDW